MVQKIILVSGKCSKVLGSAFRNFLALVFCYVWESLCCAIGMYIMYYVSVSTKRRLVKMSIKECAVSSQEAKKNKYHYSRDF